MTHSEALDKIADVILSNKSDAQRLMIIVGILMSAGKLIVKG